ncbi:MAG: GTP-binding protein [Alphaproteobacteria bacterium]
MTPLTVIGGFLGAGKTTLLNNLLRARTGVRLAVLVNDFGDLAIDGDLIAAHDGDTITLANGCVCCSMGDDLLRGLMTVMARPEPPEQILIEASGVADPKPISDVGELHPKLTRDLVIVLADAETLAERHADRRLNDTVERQLRAADLVLLNKCDVASDAAKDAARALIARLAPAAKLVETSQAALDPAVLTLPALPHQPAPPHHHDQQFSTVTLRRDAPYARADLEAKLADLPDAVLRAKGPVRLDDGRTWLAQRAGRRLDLSAWPGAPSRTRLVIIGTADMPDVNWFARTFDAEVD